MELVNLLEKQRDFFGTGVTKSIEFRKQQLAILKKSIQKYETEILDALRLDLNKSEFEAYETEVGIVLDEIGTMIKKVKKLSKPKRVPTPISHFPAVSKIYQEPYGIALIMAPWNYPFQLAVAPLIGAIAAGNCCVIKPSEYAPHTSAVLTKVISDVFAEDYIVVVEGDVVVNQQLLKLKFDTIFFTGSVGVGKIVMEAAAKHLTPVTLELGGKSPCIVEQTADIDQAAKSIVWGKFINGGQTCVAPDYLLVHESIKSQLIVKIREYINQLYGQNPMESSEYCKVIHEKHFRRLVEFLKDGKITIGGKIKEETLQIEPTILEDVTWESPVMQEEIFGPILPIMVFDQLSEVVEQVNERPKPLAFYCFTKSKQVSAYLVDHISFGGGCINDTIMHVASAYLPFGGVGESGMGSYHGKQSFYTFSHSKGVLNKKGWLDVPLRYPPYGKKIKMLRRFLK